MAQVRLSWVLPSTRSNGVGMGPDEVHGVEIRMSADGGTNFGGAAWVLATEPQEFVVDNLVAGSYLFRMVVEDKDGRRSDSYDAPADVLAAPSALADVTVEVTG